MAKTQTMTTRGSAVSMGNAASRETKAAKKPIRKTVDQIRDRESFKDRGRWLTHANCRDVDPEELFVKGAAQHKAIAICRHCPVVLQCRADALDNKIEYGVWGGMTERQRRALLRENPQIRNWADFFAGQLEALAARRAAEDTTADIHEA